VDYGRTEDGVAVINMLIRRMHYPMNPLFPAVRRAVSLMEVAVAAYLLKYAPHPNPVQAAFQACIHHGRYDALGYLVWSKKVDQHMFDPYIQMAENQGDEDAVAVLLEFRSKAQRPPQPGLGNLMMGNFPANFQMPPVFPGGQ
jgi:hypothetical protein